MLANRESLVFDVALDVAARADKVGVSAMAAARAVVDAAAFAGAADPLDAARAWLGGLGVTDTDADTVESMGRFIPAAFHGLRY